MRRKLPAASQSANWRGLSRRLQTRVQLIAVIALSLFCGVSVADTATAEDSEAATNAGSHSWLQQEFAKFRKYPYIDRAERLIGSGQSTEAAIELKRVLAMDPGDVEVRLRLIALLLGPLDEPDRASVQASKLIEQGRKLGLGYHYRALASLRLEDADSAASDWTRALETKELSKDRQRYIRRQLADIAIQRGDFAAVPPLLEKNAADQPFEDQLRLVGVYLELDRRADASQMLFDVLRDEDEVPPEGWLSIARFQLALGKPALAAVTINRGLERVKTATIRRELATSRGHLYMQRGKSDQAARAYALAAQEGEPDPHLYLAWAQALSESRLTAQALEVLETVEQTSLYGQRLHAQLLTELGRPEDAAHVLTQLLESPAQQENSGVIALEIAELHAQAGDLDAQMVALEHAVSLAPEYPPALHALAERQIGAGLLASASATLRRLIAVEDRPAARFRLVDVLLASSNHQAALVELRQLVENLSAKHPDRTRMLRQWATLAEAEQEWVEAARAWEALYFTEGSRSPELLLQAGRAARLGMQPEAARQLLAKLDIDAQELSVRAVLFEERAQLAAMQGDFVAAAKAQQEAAIAQPTAERHYRLAQTWKELGQTVKARRALEQSVSLAPGNAGYHASLAYAYLEEANDQRAAQHFEEALAVDPGQLSLYEELGYTYRRLGRDEAGAQIFAELISRRAKRAQPNSSMVMGTESQKGGVARVKMEQVQALRRAGKSKQALDVLESIDDLSVDGTRLKAELLMESGEFEHAERVLSRLLDNPSKLQEPGAIALMTADMHARTGDTDAQLAALERAVALAPHYAPALHALAERQVGAGDLLAAANTQRRLIAIEDGIDARVRLVDILLVADNFDAASVELRRLMEVLAPDHSARPKVMQQWARVAQTLGQWAVAAEAWEALYQTSDSQPEELLLRAGRAARLSGQRTKADRILAQISTGELTLDDQALLHEERARLASLQADALGAVAAQRRSVQAKPTAERHHRLAQYLLKLDEPDNARSEYQRAVMLAPGNPEFQASLGYAYLNAGDEGLAVGHFEAALAADPQRLPLYEQLGYVYRRLGQDKAAAAAFRQRIDRAQPLEASAVSGGFQSESVGSSGTDEAGYWLRREVQQLEERLRVNAGLFVRRMHGGDSSAANTPLGLTGFQSQAGLDMGYRLDSVSDGRFVEVFGRSLWAFEKDTFSPIGSQTQGGVGLRVKPFAPVNFFLSGERLVALGSDARNDWLVRASASFNRGSGYVPDQQYQHYRSVYLDAAKVVEDSAEFLVGEWREGVAVRIGQGLNLAPYGVAAASYTDDAETERRYEIGPGIALRGWLGGDTYHTHSGHFELGLEYRAVVGGNTDEDSGIVVRLQIGL